MASYPSPSSSDCEPIRLDVCATQGATLTYFWAFSPGFAIDENCEAELTLRLGTRGYDFGRFSTGDGNFEIRTVTTEGGETVNAVRLFIKASDLALIKAQRYFYTLSIDCDCSVHQFEGFFDLRSSGQRPAALPMCDVIPDRSDCCKKPEIISQNDDLVACRARDMSPLVFEVDLNDDGGDIMVTYPHGRHELYAFVNGQYHKNDSGTAIAARWRVLYYPYAVEGGPKWTWDHTYRGGGGDCCGCDCDDPEPYEVCITATNDCGSRCRKRYCIDVDDCGCPCITEGGFRSSPSRRKCRC